MSVVARPHPKAMMAYVLALERMALGLPDVSYSFRGSTVAWLSKMLYADMTNGKKLCLGQIQFKEVIFAGTNLESVPGAVNCANGPPEQKSSSYYADAKRRR